MTDSSTCGGSISILSLPACFCRSRCASQMRLISPWAMSSASRITASDTSFAPASTIRMASSLPATIRSSGLSRNASSLGLTTKPPSSSWEIRTAPTGIGNGMSEIIRAALVPFIARMSYGYAWSTDIGIATSWVSRFHPFGKSGRSGLLIVEPVKCRLLYRPAFAAGGAAGILPAAYMRSSTSTVRGRKSTSRGLPAVAVTRTLVSPASTTTAPLAWRASFPVSRRGSSFHRAPAKPALHQTCGYSFHAASGWRLYQ